MQFSLNFLLFFFVLCEISCLAVEIINEIPANGTHSRFSFIYPGTKWCGPGDIAQNYNDLGPERDVDMCCREHDRCPDVIETGKTNHNLTNYSFATVLHCDCDNKLHKCLQEVKTLPAIKVGNIYFNLFDKKCFKNEYPIVRCTKYYNLLLIKKCQEYELDTKSEKKFQWFDVPVF